MNLLKELEKNNIDLDDYDYFCTSCNYDNVYIIKLKKTISAIERERKERERSRNIDNDYFSFVSSEITTIYKKPTGEIIFKNTKRLPRNYHNNNSYDHDNWNLKRGQYNSYGHQVIDYYSQYYFKL